MRTLFIAVAIWSLAGCTGVFARSSRAPLSFGDHGGGRLVGGISMPATGVGYAVPAAWRSRDALYTTFQIHSALARSFALVDSLLPGGLAPLGDISRRGGGPAAGHGSHRSGRDADIFFYALDDRGRPLPHGEAMLKFAASGRAVMWSPALGHKAPKGPVPAAWFDVPRTWALVRALLSDPAIAVQWIFIHKELGKLLIRRALLEGESPDLVAQAEEILRQPGDSAPHDDHMHVRFYCDPSQREIGCVDRGPQRWLKKYWKYLPKRDEGPLAEPLLATQTLAP